jgi:hypothetical protein
VYAGAQIQVDLKAYPALVTKDDNMRSIVISIFLLFGVCGHWGRDWQRRHSGWDRWDRASAPAPAPLPSYQKSYTHERYPRIDQQRNLQNQNYGYKPHDPVIRAPARPSPRQGREQGSKNPPHQQQNSQRPADTSPKGNRGKKEIRDSGQREHNKN